MRIGGMLFVIGMIIVLFLCLVVAMGLWTYRDAKARGLEAGVWTAVVILIPNFIGLLLYFLVGRKQEQVRCPACGKSTERRKPYCANCGQPLDVSLQNAVHKTSKKPLVVMVACVVLMFALSIGAVGTYMIKNAAMFSAPNISIGQAQTARPGVWKLSFWYFDGEKARTIERKSGAPDTLSVQANVKKGNLALAITVDGVEKERLPLNDLAQDYRLDLSQYADTCDIVVHLYGEGAEGSVDLSWKE